MTMTDEATSGRPGGVHPSEIECIASRLASSRRSTKLRLRKALDEYIDEFFGGTEAEAMKSYWYYVTATDYSPEKVPEIEGKVVLAVKAALSLTLPIASRRRMSPKEAVGEFCTQLRRAVSQEPCGSAAKGVVMRMASPKCWSAPGVPSTISDISIKNERSSTLEVIMTARRVEELVGRATACESSAEDVAMQCLSSMERNLRDADLVIFGGKQVAEAGAALVGQIHDVAARAEEEFGDAA